jgi:sugar/nucleoside kinase (ribokinase family)
MPCADVVVAGYICLDLIPALAGSGQITPGHSIEVGPMTFATGGAVANTGGALHKLGVSTAMVAKVGDDLLGQTIRQLIAQQHIALAEHLVTAPQESTAYTIIISPSDADRSFFHSPGCNLTFGSSDVSDDVLGGARLLHFGYPPLMPRMYAENGRELVALLHRAKALGLTTSVDMTLTDPNKPTGKVNWQSILAATLPFVDLFLPSVEELLQMLRPRLFQEYMRQGGRSAILEQVPDTLIAELGQELLDMGARVVGLKAGDRGFYLRTAAQARLTEIGNAGPLHESWANRELWAPCYRVAVAGTTGAGDATIAGLLMALLQRMPVEQALNTACAVGACCCEAADALSGVRSWPETAARMGRGWPRLPLELDPSLWRKDTFHHIWFGPRDQQ